MHVGFFAMQSYKNWLVNAKDLHTLFLCFA